MIDYGATGDVHVEVDAQCKFNASAFATLGISKLTSLVANVSFTKSDGLHECSLNEGYINNLF